MDPVLYIVGALFLVGLPFVIVLSKCNIIEDHLCDLEERMESLEEEQAFSSYERVEKEELKGEKK